MLPEVQQFQKWLRRKSPHASTYIHYTNDVQLFFTWRTQAPATITLRDVDAFIEHCQQRGQRIATINRRLASLRAFYQFLALELENAPTNPVIPKRHFIRQGRRLPHDVPDAQLMQLFHVITSVRDRAMFLLMLRCGLRVSEVRNLSLNDVYLQPTTGHLPRLWVQGKGSVERVAYLSAQPCTALQAWLAQRPSVVEPAVFLNRFSRRLSVTGIQDRLAVYCRQCDCWLTCHQLRHTFARHLVEARVPVTTIQRLLGHARLRTTELYLHIADSQVQADYEAAMRLVSQRLPLDSEAGQGGVA